MKLLLHSRNFAECLFFGQHYVHSREEDDDYEKGVMNEK